MPLRHENSKKTTKKRKKTLITGGAGFVGSHLAERLLADGYEVTVLDNLSTGRTENVASLDGDPSFRLVVGDILDKQLTDRLVADCDIVFHLAAAVGVRLILSEAIQSFRTNVLGTETVLESAARHRTKVLVASTSEVYGKVTRLPQKEDDDVLLGPTCVSRWSYAASKMLDEFMALAYHREGLPAVAFRLFNTVGPRQTGRYGMVVPRFVEAALSGCPLPVHGDGLQSRCFLHVEDAVDGIVRLANARAAVGQVFNIGSVEQVTILELAKRVLGAAERQRMVESDQAPLMLASASQDMISFTSYEEAYPEGGFEDIRCRMPDISKIHAVTKWRPRRTLDDVLADVVAERAAILAPAFGDVVAAPEEVPALAFA